MKKFTSALIASLLLFTSCEEVVDVNLNSAPPRLVVEGSMNWLKGSIGSFQTVKLSTTTGFYNNFIPAVTGAEVAVYNSKGNAFHFYENDEYSAGIYVCTDFEPVMGERYTLRIRYKDEIYTADEMLLPVPDLENVEQAEEGFIEGQQTIKAFFTDPANETNFYMHRFAKEDKSGQSAIFDDRFVNGNYTYTVRLFDDLEAGENLSIELYSISARYYDYMSKIYTTTSEGNTGPFQTAPASLRGNVVNETNPDNYAFGYFRLSEVSSIQYTVQ